MSDVLLNLCPDLSPASTHGLPLFPGVLKHDFTSPSNIIAILPRMLAELAQY